MRKILIFCLIISAVKIFSMGEPEVTTVNSGALPEISVAYSWGYGFRSILEKFQSSVKDQFLLELQENNGLNHKEKILIDASSGSLPDVFTFWSYETNLKFLAANNLIIDSQEFFNESKVISRDDFYGYALDATKIDGVNYAIPHELFFGYFAINRSIFNNLNLNTPKTWSDLIKVSETLNNNGYIPFSMGSFRGDPGHLFFSALTYQDPTGYSDTLNIKNSNSFNYVGNYNAANAVLDLIENRVVPSNTIFDGSFDEQINQYNNRKAAMIFAFTWSLARFEYDIAQETEVIPVPLISENSLDTSKFTVGGASQSLCISRKAWNNPQKRPYIIKLVEWLLSEEVFTKRIEQSGSYPARIMDYPKMDNPIYKKVDDYVQGKEILGLHEFYFNSLYSFNQFKKANDLLWSGSLTTTEFMKMVENGMVYDND